MYHRTEILDIKSEAKHIYTVRFEFKQQVDPGQFVMVWMPGIDEFPMSLSYTEDLKGITFKVIGKGTEHLANMKVGEKIWIRGPYGNGYQLPSTNFIAVSGGTGLASLAPLLEKASNFHLIIGAKNKEELFFTERFENYADQIYITTDDGSYGAKGLATDMLANVLKVKKYGAVYTCGPEKMVKKVIELGIKYKINVFASLERFMKCGIGICDSCTVNGYRVCVDGPVFSLGSLLEMKDLGFFTKALSGKKIGI